MDDESVIEKVIYSSNIYEGQLFNLRVDTVKMANERVIDRETVEHPRADAIIPIFEERIILTRQFRQASRKIQCELPAGTLIKGRLTQ